MVMDNSINTSRRGLLAALVFVFLMLAVSGCGYRGAYGSGEEAPAPALTEEQVQLNLESFDMVWQTIRDKHWDPELGGIDWQAVSDELRPQVAAATTMTEARSTMQEMIARLGQSHFGIFPASVYEDAAAATGGEDEDGTGTGGSAGMEVRVRDGRVLVVSVLDGSPADQAGVRPGWEVLKVRDLDLTQRVARLDSSMHQTMGRGLVLSMAMQAKLSGNVDQVLEMELLDAQGKEVSRELTLVQARGTLTTLGNLPSVRVWHETRTLPGGIGYFGFNYFLGIMEVMPAFNQAMQDFADARGMIIDLRGNPGGLGAMAMGMAGWFVEGKGSQLGVMTMRTGDLNFAINPRARGYHGPLAILIDEVSASTSEIMAGGLQDLGRAKLFGITSAGAALPSVIDKLPNGDGFQYAIANYVSQGGKELEGNGVAPDFEIACGREDLLKEGDPVLKEALAWIESQ
jgi:carboxyl-terminal processing protease